MYQIDIAWLEIFFSTKQQQPITSIFPWLYIVMLVVGCLVLRFFNNNIQRHKHQSIVDAQHVNKTLPADKIELCANCGKEGRI